MREPVNRPRRSSPRLASARPLPEPVALALSIAGVAGIRTVGPDRWTARLAPRGRPAAIRLEDDWLVIEAAASRALDHLIQQDGTPALVAAHVLLPAGAKLVMPGGDRPLEENSPCPRLLARAEIPAAASDDTAHERLTARVRLCCNDLRRALSVKTSDVRSPIPHGPVGPAPESGAGEDRDPTGNPDLLELLATAGWTASPGGDSAIRVTLANPAGGFRQAAITATPSSACLYVDLAPDPGEAVAEPHLSAVAGLLLRAAGTIRLARPFSRRGGAELGFEVRLPAPYGAEDLDLALSALSVAAAQTAGEVEALARDRGLCRSYVAQFATRSVRSGSGYLSDVFRY